MSLFLRDVTLFCLESRQNVTPAPRSGDPVSNTFPHTDYPVWTVSLPSAAPEVTKQHTAISILTTKPGPRAIDNPPNSVSRVFQFYVRRCFTAFPSHRYPMKTKNLPRPDRLPYKLEIQNSQAKIGTWRQRRDEHGKKKDEEGEIGFEE